MHAIFLQHLASPPFVVWRPRPHVPEAASPAASAVQPHVLQAPPRGCNRVLRVPGLIGLRARACRGGGEREHAQPRAVGVLRHVAHAHLAHARQGGGQARRPLPYRRHRERQADQLRPCDALPRARAHGERPHALVQDRHGLPAHHGASQGELHRRCHRVQGCSDQHCRRVPRHPLRPAGASSKCDVALCSLPTAHCSLLTAHCSLLTAHCPLLTAHHSLLTAHHSPLTAHHSPLTTIYLYLYLQWDRKSGYRTRSILCVPIVDVQRGGKCIGCLQLINKRDRYGRLGTVLFNKRDVELATNLASVVSIAVKCTDQEQQANASLDLAVGICKRRTGPGTTPNEAAGVGP
jgi:hypothetical protein